MYDLMVQAIVDKMIRPSTLILKNRPEVWLILSSGLGVYFFENHYFLAYWAAISLACIFSYRLARSSFENFSFPHQTFILVALVIPYFLLSPGNSLSVDLWETSTLTSNTSTAFSYLGLIEYNSGMVWPLKILWALLHLVNSLLISKISTKKSSGYIYLLSPFVLLEGVGLVTQTELLVCVVMLAVYGLKKHQSIFLGPALFLVFWMKGWFLVLLILILKSWNIRAALYLLALFALTIFCFNLYPNSFMSTNPLEGFSTHAWGTTALKNLMGHTALSLVTLILSLRLAYLFIFGGRPSNQLWEWMRWALILSPVLHPYLVVLPLSLALLENQRATFLVLSIFVCGLHDTDIPFTFLDAPSPWLGGLFILLLFLKEWRFRKYFLSEKGVFIQKFSILTPTFNEAENIPHLHTSLVAQGDLVGEWIVVDAGSQDQTAHIAESCGASVLKAAQAGRGHQISQALEAAKYPWQVIVHADSRLEPQALLHLRETIQDRPGLIGGAFKMAYRDSRDLGLLKWLNEFKTRYLGLSFGDQSQFVHYKKLQAKGGYPHMDLMEDVELSLLFKGSPEAFICTSKSLTSPRRWKAKGRVRNSLRIISLLLHYLFARQIFEKVDVKKMFISYYGNKPGEKK